MNDHVKIVECPRDAWQGMPAQIAPETKAAYLRQLVAAGFKHIDAVSFVSPAAVPQMADSELVLEYIMPSAPVEIIGIVVNEKGVERAIHTEMVQTVGFPYSISEQFLGRNQHQTREEALHSLEKIASMATDVGMNVVAYLSMAFGNPYGDPWSVGEVMEACEQMIDAGVQQISLADTVGLASPELIARTLDSVLPARDGVEIGVHLHARRGEAAAHIRAAYGTGCRRFDAAIGGLGGCPFAQDALVGNIPTEVLIGVLAECGAQLPPLQPLDELIAASAEIARYGAIAGLKSEVD